MPDPNPASRRVGNPKITQPEEGDMTTATIEVEDELVEETPRRIVVFTLAVLLPPEFNDADIADIIPAGVTVNGWQDFYLSAFIQTTVQEARLVMT